jgi:hypothetical protein
MSVVEIRAPPRHAPARQEIGLLAVEHVAELNTLYPGQASRLSSAFRAASATACSVS